jgi:hypothetical protein
LPEVNVHAGAATTLDYAQVKTRYPKVLRAPEGPWHETMNTA